ncbi:MAG: M23 family metallopeptidase [Chryseolinea sp.]
MKQGETRDKTSSGDPAKGWEMIRWPFFAPAFLIALFLFLIVNPNFDSIKDTLLRQENQSLRAELKAVEDRMHRSADDLNKLIEKDDRNYRTILDTGPLPIDIRTAGSGGREKFNVSELKNHPALHQHYMVLSRLQGRLEVERQSFENLLDLLNKKLNMWSSRPAIQPISNKHLKQLHLSFGTRFHPIYKVMRAHRGLDLAARKGTPVYATGDGTVLRANTSGSYGRVIYLDHGHGYETRYAHLSSLRVAEGDSVKRGQVIGLVGNTGTSLSAHLHYEVIYRGKHLNPINFFQRDLSNSEYERLIELSAARHNALD